jgi:hypothetical protein
MRLPLPLLAAGLSLCFAAGLPADADTAKNKPGSFTWHDTPNQFMELRFGDRAVLRYVYAPLDESSKEARARTFKVFHHLFDPAGTRIVTNGPGGKFPHHRGLFYGFNKVSYGTKKADVWHCTGDAFQSHDGFVSSEGNDKVARQKVKGGWHGPGKEVFAREEREVTVYDRPGGTLLDWSSTLTSAVDEPVKLDGDPQHAGFHFRADNEVDAKSAKETYYLRPDGKGKPGETRNWPAQKTHVNLPWDAMSFVLGGRRYTVLYLDHPRNPKEARFSERDYGRFGSYFEYTLTKEKPLTVRYRVWLQDGEMTGEQCESMSREFTSSATTGR